ncbi:NgoFVII family restriction endonuclease [Candidatus Desantisbacteria bacterium]|nr:NgoFVII family restriction endonuclease [Candidatus Desantisbacteria bacterium]
MPKIYDNIENHLIQGLNDTLEVSHRADFCVGYFNLRGWKQVVDKIDRLKGGDENSCRLLIGMQKPPLEIIRDYFSKTEQGIMDNKTASAIRKKLAQEFREQLTIGIPTKEDEMGLRRLSRQIKDKKVTVKLFLRYQLHAKLYLLFRDDKISPIIGYLGSSNLTLAGLLKQGELNIDVLEQDAALKLAGWFEDRWADQWCIDISKELIEIIDSSWAADKLRLPYHIYLKIAYHLSREARAGLTEFKIPKILQEKLLNFQQKAVFIAAHYLNKRDGVLIGDVVGLGKTLTATAIAKIFEEDFFLETLIICPKNLTNMWEDYAHKYQLRAKVLPVTQVQAEMPKLRRYRIVIIDESHNLRNREGKRYRAIQEYIQLNDSKVILLTATPYNKTYLDLSNQLRLFISEDKDLGISPERFIESIGGRVQFMSKYPYSATTLPAFEKSDFADDWRELMRLYMVRRPRSFIKQHYAEIDQETKKKYLLFNDGRRSYFPDRMPKKVEYEFNPNDPDDQYARLYSDNIVDIINGLNLPRYGWANYLDKKTTLIPTKDEEIIKENLSRAGKRMMGFCRTNLFKRLESSGYSFLLSLSRHILRNFVHVYAIENNLPLPIGTQEANIFDDFPEDTDTDNSGDDSTLALSTPYPSQRGTRVKGLHSLLFNEEDYYIQSVVRVYKSYETQPKSRFDWIRSGLFQKDLKDNLIHDSKEIMKILTIAQNWNPDNDRQLNALFELCTKKHYKEKVLIFTQFADTANYLCNELKKREVKQIEVVTGECDDPTAFAYRFSPFSNEKSGIAGSDEEIRILITTDVLSEGQNLQDCHIIVNYDLPWALIRLIQRAGRVDRIGQKAEKILCYSFLPEDGIERIINLRERLKGRIRQNAEVVGSDETFFDGDPVKIHDFYNEKSGMLDENDSDEIDLSSYAYQIWKNATDADPSLKKTIPELPDVIYSTKAFKEDKLRKEGVITYARTAEDNDVMVWVDRKGEIITQSQWTILKSAECSADTPPMMRLDNHHYLVGKAIEHIRQYERLIGGQLGKTTGARYKTYMRLNRYYEENKGTLFVNDALKWVIDDIYKYPLKEFSRDTLNRQLKSGISDEDIANLVISLRDDDRLCLINEEESAHKEPQIICSLGMVRE